MKQHGLSRRRLIQLSLGGAIFVPIGPAIAQSARLNATPRQTQGPFYPNWRQDDLDADMTQIAGSEVLAAGDIIEVSGQVLDQAGQPIEGASVDVWQANAAGRYAHPADRNPAPLDEGFQGWAQLRTDREGRYRFRSIMPGPYPASRGWSRPPHIHFKVSKSGFGQLTTQMYFAGHPLNDIDLILAEHSPSERSQLVVPFDTSDTDRTIAAGFFPIVLERTT